MLSFLLTLYIYIYIFTAKYLACLRIFYQLLDELYDTEFIDLSYNNYT